MNKLFSPVNINGHTLKNRVVFPPMVCFGWSDDTGLVSEDHIKHYAELAKGGVGLIIIEATCVNKDGRLASSQLGVWSDEQIEGLRKIGEACHKHGSKVLVQIHHAGIKSPESVIETPVSSSEHSVNGRTARELTQNELKAIQKDFVDAAIRVKKAGLDGIEIHGAHGYLISQFMSPLVNKRLDEYGGELANRARFAIEIVQMIKAEVGEGLILGYRMGANEPTLENGIEIAKLLEKAGVELLHVSAGIQSEELPKAPEGAPYNWIVNMGIEVKKHISIPVIVVNGIRTPELASYIVDNDLADLTAIGRAQLTDHHWAQHAMNNEDIVTCVECPRCLWYTDGKKCPRYSKNF